MCEKNLNLKFLKLKQFVLNCLNNINSQEIICINIDQKYNITDLMIICTGQSRRHVISIAQDLSYKLRNIGFKSYKIEGLESGEWILIDLKDIVIHIMQKHIRMLYALENLWN